MQHMLLRLPLNLLILAIIVRFSTSQYPPCYLCGTGYQIAYPNNYVIFQDGTYKYCGTVESDALYGYIAEAFCLSYQQSIPQKCGCQEIQPPPTSPQQPPTLPPFPTWPTQPPFFWPQELPTGVTRPATAPQPSLSASATAPSPSTTSVGAIVGYAIAALLGACTVLSCVTFHNYGTFNFIHVSRS